MKLNSTARVATAVLALAGCVGGPGREFVPGLPSPSVAAAKTVPVKIVIKARRPHRRHRGPRYVSLATLSVAITVTPQGQAALPRAVVNCTSQVWYSYVLCSGTVAARPGNNTFAVALYDQLNAKGSILSQGSTTAVMRAGINNTIKVTTSGLINAIAIRVSCATAWCTTLWPGSPQTIVVNVIATDAGGYTIIGSYVNPVSLHDSDSSGATRLSTSALTSSSQTATLAYTGATLSSATISASASGVPTANMIEATVHGAYHAGDPPNWTPVGPFEQSGPAETGAYQGGSGKLNAVAVDPTNPSIIYVAGGVGRGNEVTTQAGIFKTVNYGATWAPIDAGLDDTVVNDLWIDPANAQLLVAATEQDGLYRTTNGGASWTAVGPQPMRTRALLEVNTTLYAGATVGVLESFDQGATWQTALATSTPINALGASGTIVYAGGDDGTSYEHVNGTWSQGGTLGGGTSGGVHSIAVDPWTPSTAYASRNAYSLTEYLNQDLWVTVNSGQTWRQVAIPPATPSSLLGGAQTIAFSKVTPGLLYVGGDTRTATFDGTHWVLSVGDTGLDQRALYVVESTSHTDSFLIASDQGLSVADNFLGSTSTPPIARGLTKGLPNSVTYGVAVSGTNIVVTMQDWDMQAGANGGSSWHSVKEPESGTVAMGTGAYASRCIYTGINLGFSDDDCQSFVSQSNTPGYAPVFDPQNPALVYLQQSAHGVLRSTNGGQTFVATGWPIGTADSIGIDPENDKNIFVPIQYANSTLEVTHDGGSTWKLATFNDPDDPQSACGYECVAVDPHNSNIVLLLGDWPNPDPTGEGYLLTVFRSTDGGATFSEIAQPLPCCSGIDASIKNVRPPNRNKRVMLRWRRNPHTRPFPSLGFPASLNSLSFNPDAPAGTTPAVVVTSNVGGAVSFDDGTTWTSLDGNAISTVFRGVAWEKGNVFIATAGEGIITAGLQPPGP